MWLIAGCIMRAPLATTPALARHHLKVNHEDPFKELQKGMPSIGITFFVLGPLPQAIKLWGMRGLPFTQTMGSLYMTVYLLTILTSLFPAPEENRRPALRTLKWINPPKLIWFSQGIYFAAFAAQVGIWIFIFFGVAGYFVSNKVTFPFVVCVLMNLVPSLMCTAKSSMISYLGRIFWIIPYLITAILIFDTFVVHGGGDLPADMLVVVLRYIFMGYYYAGEWILILPCVFTVVALCSGLIYLTDLTIKLLANNLTETPQPDSESGAETSPMINVPQQDSKPDAERGIEIVSQTVHVASVKQQGSSSIPEPSHHTTPQASQSKPSWTKYGSQYWSIAFAVTNLICSLLYYGYIYDANGTQKPAWTEILG